MQRVGETDSVRDVRRERMEPEAKPEMREMRGERVRLEDCPYSLRADIGIPSKFMADLPVDKRGYPVPWFVDWINGEPEFRAMDMQKFRRAISGRLCWTCGKPLFGEEVFVIGPMCAVNRISAEPPSHRECAIYAALNCPFLSRPHAHRRTDEQFNAAKKPASGIMIERNPGVTLLWYCKRHELINSPHRPGIANPGVLFRIGRAFKTEWYREGRTATRAEVLEGIESGLPLLRETSEKHDGPQGKIILEMQITHALRLAPR